MTTPPRATYNAHDGEHTLHARTFTVAYITRAARQAAALTDAPRPAKAGWYWHEFGRMHGPFASSRAAFRNACSKIGK